MLIKQHIDKLQRHAMGRNLRWLASGAKRIGFPSNKRCNLHGRIGDGELRVFSGDDSNVDVALTEYNDDAPRSHSGFLRRTRDGRCINTYSCRKVTVGST